MIAAGISGGGAFLIWMTGIGVGFLIAVITYERNHDEHKNEVAQEWGKIGDAADAAYRGAHKDATMRYELPQTEEQREQSRTAARLSAVYARRPWITLTCNGSDPEKAYVLDGAGFQAMAGVTQETVLAALGWPVKAR